MKLNYQINDFHGLQWEFFHQLLGKEAKIEAEENWSKAARNNEKNASKMSLTR